MLGFYVALLLYTAPCCQGQQDFEAGVTNYLRNNITNYDPLLLPRLNQSKVVYITMDTMLSQIVAVDTAKQSMRISAFIQAAWEEERLVWDPVKFGNVSVVNWDSSKIWFPVVIVYNGIGDSQILVPQLPVYMQSKTPSLSIVAATWRREFEFSCQFNMTRFPIDHHTCELEFFFSDQGHGDKMVVPERNTYYPFNPLALYKPSSEWTLHNMTTSAEMKSYSLIQGMPNLELPTYVIHLEIQRVSSYYFMNVITPLLLLTLLQVLVYFVPLESGEKLGFGITIMLSYTVFLLLLDGIVPKSQSTPAIASFITAAMILSTISLLLTSLIMRFHFAPEGTRMPACARAVFVRFLGRLFCVGGATQVAQTPSDVSESSVRKAEGGAAVRSDWVLAAQAMERFMVALGVIATAVIIGVFIIAPYTPA